MSEPPQAPSVSNATLGAVCIAAALGVAALVALKGPPAPRFDQVDEAYARWQMPVPPLKCRRGGDASELAHAIEEPSAMATLSVTSPEAAFLKAHAAFEAGTSLGGLLATALSCEGFAAAQGLAGEVALRDGQPRVARGHFARALLLAPRWFAARTGHIRALLEEGRHDEAEREASGLIAEEPSRADGYFFRFLASGAQADLCRAAQGGFADAIAVARQRQVCEP